MAKTKAKSKKDTDVKPSINVDKVNDFLKDPNLLVKRNEEVMDKAQSLGEHALVAAESMMSEMRSQLISLIGDDAEKIKRLDEIINYPKNQLMAMTYNSVQLADLYNYFVAGGQPLDQGIMFIMNDYYSGVMLNSTTVPLHLLNVHDSEVPGINDPAWTTDPMPLTEVVANPGSRIPVRVETLKEVYYGYLSCFSFEVKREDNKVVRIQTNHPGISTKRGWIGTNSIYRWMEVSEEAVKNAWLTKAHSVTKVDRVAEALKEE